MRRRAAAVQVGLHLHIAGDARRAAFMAASNGLQRQRGDLQPQRHRRGGLRRIRAERGIEMAFRQIGRERVEPQPAAVQIDVRRDGAVDRAAGDQLRDAQLHIGIGKSQQIERDRRVRNEPAAGSRLGGRSGRRGAAPRRRAGRRLGERGKQGVEIDLVGRRHRLHRWPSVLTSRRGALDRQARPQGLHAQVERDRRGRLGPRSSAAGAPSEPVSVAGELSKLPWAETCTG